MAPLHRLLIVLHNRFGFALILFAVVLGLWGTYRLLRHQSVTPSYRSSFLLMIGLTAVQGLVGVILFGLHPPRYLLHVVYGLFAIVFLPGIYFWVNRSSPLRENAFLAIACWVVAIAYARGYGTGLQ